MDMLSAVLWLTLNVYHEARSEEQLAQIAVAHVTLNRSKERNQTIKQVVLEPFQFSWTLKGRDEWWPKDIKALQECFESAKVAVQGYDFTRGATYYHHKRINPYWAASYASTGSWGAHVFYREN